MYMRFYVYVARESKHKRLHVLARVLMNEFEQDQRSTAGSAGGSGPPAAVSTASPNAITSSNASPSRLDGNAPPSRAARRGDSDDMDDEMEDSGSSDQSPDSLTNEAGGGRGNSNSSPPTGSSSSPSSSQQLGASSSGASSTSPPVRRLQSVLRPSPANASGASATGANATGANTTGGNDQPTNASPSRNVMNPSNTKNENAPRQLYGGGNTPTGNSGAYASSSSSLSSPGNGASAMMAMRSSHVTQYYAHVASSSSVESPSMSRGYGHDRVLPSPTNGGGNGGSSTQLGGQSSSASTLNQSGRSGIMTSSPREAMDVDGGSGVTMRGQKRRLGQYDPRYASDHHMPSNSGNAAINRQQQQQQEMANQYQYQQQLQQLHHMEDDDDDEVGGGGNSAAIESSASRGSHGPRDALRYETWTSKQLRKKCSHLKLRGLKNVKKHVMVDALYRYYRNQRQKELIGGGGMASKATTGATSTNSNTNSNDQQQPQAQQSRLRGDMQSMNDGYNSRGSRYEHSGSSASSSVAAYPSSNNAAIHRSRAGSGNSNNNSNVSSVSDRTSNSHLNSNSSSLAATRSKQPSAMSSTKPTPQIVRHQRAHTMTYDDMDLHDMDMLDGNEERKQNQPRHHGMLDDEIHVTSEDVIRLVDVVLSPVFVDRLAVELSRWQFWVDVRERYIAMLNNSAGAVSSSYASSSRNHHHMLTGNDMANHRGASMHGNRSSLVSSRNCKWSSMQLWEIWKELTFAYTKTCFEFTAAGSDERDYINFCEGRPDVYYLHQRLHARPDLLHLIKSNEYIEEKATSDASESIAAAQATAAQDVHNNNSAVQMIGSGASPSSRGGHKRFKRIVPAPNQANVMGVGLGPIATSASGAPVSSNVNSDNSLNSNGNGSGTSSSQPLGNATARRGVASSRDFLVDSSENSPSNGEGGSTENSETTVEDGSLVMKSSNNASDSAASSQYHEVLTEQKYFGLLLQNFEAIFESLHNKKVLLAALRKDSNAPDHMIADLHDDIHVLSALKREFRNKLRNTLG
ncbi:hypothetical protein FI667_g6770, partial [Globisporangium splendens]